MASSSAVHDRSALGPTSSTLLVAVPVQDEPTASQRATPARAQQPSASATPGGALLTAVPVGADDALSFAPAPPAHQDPRAVRLSASVPRGEANQVGALFPGLGEWLWHMRRGLTAGFASGLTHFVLLIVLGAFVTAEVKHVEPPLPPLEVAVVNPERPRIDPPVVAKIEAKTPQVKSTANSVGSGSGSAGSGGGRGGGVFGGLQVAVVAPRIPAAAAAGGTGFGTDKAYGDHMLGEVGELKTEATFFGVKADGKKFCYVVDTSGSMAKNDRYLRCRDELIRSVRGLGYGQKYFIVFFNTQTFPMPERKLVDVKPKQMETTVRWILGAVPAGFTEPWDGLAMALRQKPDAIYLLTDGEFSEAVLQKIIAAQPSESKKIPIHTIAFESTEGEKTLQTIARVTGGKYIYVP